MTEQDLHEALVHWRRSMFERGSVVSGTTLDIATYNVEELVDAARFAITMRGQKARYLTASDVADLETAFDSR